MYCQMTQIVLRQGKISSVGRRSKEDLRIVRLLLQDLYLLVQPKATAVAILAAVTNGRPLKTADEMGRKREEEASWRR